MNFASVIGRFATGSYVVTRRAPTTVGDDGRADLATASTFTIRAAVQPVSGRDLQRLPEGMRVSERRAVYTTASLRAIGDPDVLSIDGADWEVETVFDQSFGGYFKVIVLKVGN